MPDSVSPGQRFTRAHPCPVCQGWAQLPQGHGSRCWGFLSSDGMYAHCAREEHAGGLLSGSDGMYAHRLQGSCKCGQEHGSAPDRTPLPALRVRRQVTAAQTWTMGQYRHVRREYDSGGKSVHWERFANGMWVLGLDGFPLTDMPLYGADALPKPEP